MENLLRLDRKTWSTGIPWALMPLPKVSELGPLDAFLRNARLWVITFSTERCIRTGCEVSQLGVWTDFVSTHQQNGFEMGQSCWEGACFDA